MNRREFIAGAGAAALSGCVAEKAAALKAPKFVKSNLIHLGMNMWGDDPAPPREDVRKADSVTWDQDTTVERNPAWLNGCADYLRFDEEVYRRVIDRMADKGFNQVLIDLGEALVYPSHPEIACKGAWSPDRMREEVRRLRSLGIEAIPKVNFSTTHNAWMGEWRRMTSSKAYYGFARDIIRDVAEIFETPRLLHLGLDEERDDMQRKYQYCVVRHEDLWWHDVKFLVNEVETCGVRAWVWPNYLKANWNKDPIKAFSKNMPKSVLLSAAYYGPLRDSTEKSPAGSKGRYFTTQYLDLAKAGYEQVPCFSNFNHDCNVGEMVPWCEEQLPRSLVSGYLMAPWRACVGNFEAFQLKAVDLAAAAFNAAEKARGLV